MVCFVIFVTWLYYIVVKVNNVLFAIKFETLQDFSQVSCQILFFLFASIS